MRALALLLVFVSRDDKSFVVFDDNLIYSIFFVSMILKVSFRFAGIWFSFHNYNYVYVYLLFKDSLGEDII